MTKYRCTVCNYVHEGEIGENFRCPLCGQPGIVFEEIKEKKIEEGKTKYSGTKTEKNLLEALTAEAKLRNKYNFFADVAKGEGYEQVYNLFLKTANNEKELSRLWFKELELLKSSKENILNIINEESTSRINMYEKFAREADEEGFHNLALKFKAVAKIEKAHEERYNKLFNKIDKKEIFEKEEKTMWECSKCGYIVEEDKAPEKCEICEKLKSFVKLRNENY